MLPDPPVLPLIYLQNKGAARFSDATGESQISFSPSSGLQCTFRSWWICCNIERLLWHCWIAESACNMFVERADFPGRGNLKIFLARSVKIKRTVLVTTHIALSPFLFLSWLGFLALHTQSTFPFSNLNFEQTVQCSERFEIDLLSVEFFPKSAKPKKFWDGFATGRIFSQIRKTQRIWSRPLCPEKFANCHCTKLLLQICFYKAILTAKCPQNTLIKTCSNIYKSFETFIVHSAHFSVIYANCKMQSVWPWPRPNNFCVWSCLISKDNWRKNIKNCRLKTRLK